MFKLLQDDQFQHMASVLASWMDNDEDGCVDNPSVLTKLLEKFEEYGVEVQPAILGPGNQLTVANS